VLKRDLTLNSLTLKGFLIPAHRSPKLSLEAQMRMAKMLVCIIVVFLAGCSKTLSRSSAQRSIENSAEFVPQQQSFTLRKDGVDCFVAAGLLDPYVTDPCRSVFGVNINRCANYGPVTATEKGKALFRVLDSTPSNKVSSEPWIKIKYLKPTHRVVAVTGISDTVIDSAKVVDFTWKFADDELLAKPTSLTSPTG
jgi:hypothetical protein